MDVQVYGRFDGYDVVRLSMYDLIILSELLNEAIGDRK